MNQPKVSVIVPSLNVEPYIRKCMDSILNQTLRDIEVIAVDADSTDGTREVLEEYASKDSRVILLTDDQKSTGYAKNIGIRNAKAPFIGIVESDDYVALDMYEKLYAKAVETGADIVKANYSTFISQGEKEYLFPKSTAQRREDYGRLINPHDEPACFTWVMYEWLGIYRKDFLLNNSIYHNESKGAAYQDTGFWFLSFAYAKSIYLMDEAFYYYRKDNPYASVRNSNRPFNICNEYEFIKDRLVTNGKLFEDYAEVFYHGYFHDNLAVYYRTRSELRPQLLQVVRERLLEKKTPFNKALYTDREWLLLNEIIKSDEEFNDKRLAEIASISENREEFLSKIKFENEIIIFGAGSYGSNLQYLLEINGIGVVAYSDNDKNKSGSVINGLTVLSPEKCMELYPNAIYLVAHKSMGNRIKEGLIEQGISDERVMVCELERIAEEII